MKELEIKAEIARLEKELIEIQKANINSRRASVIKPLVEYTGKEKVAFFNKMYAMAEGELAAHEMKNYDDNSEYYVWEAVMELLARNEKEFWEYWRSI